MKKYFTLEFWKSVFEKKTKSMVPMSSEEFLKLGKPPKAVKFNIVDFVTFDIREKNHSGTMKIQPGDGYKATLDSEYYVSEAYAPKDHYLSGKKILVAMSTLEFRQLVEDGKLVVIGREVLV